MRQTTTFLTISFLLISLIHSNGQTSVLRYSTIKGIRDTLNRYRENHTLFFSATESLDVINNLEDISVKSPKSFWVPTTNGTDKQPTIWKNLKTRRYVERRELISQTLEDDSLPNILWQFRDGTRKIGGYSCNSAEADIRGRHFIVWYTSAVPVSNGPWKLHGLPGLILAGEDTTRKVIFVFESLVSAVQTPLVFDGISKINGIKYLPFVEYKKHFNETITNRIKLRHIPDSDLKGSFAFYDIDFIYEFEY